LLESWAAQALSEGECRVDASGPRSDRLDVEDRVEAGVPELLVDLPVDGDDPPLLPVAQRERSAKS
jgi:hypothetical protein